MTPTWSRLARDVGRKSVMSPTISDAELDAETARQTPIILDAIRPHIKPSDGFALDYGCGYGRFTAAIASLTKEGWGYDPCEALLPKAKGFYSSVEGWFSPLFVFCVLGNRELDTSATADHIVSLLAPNGLLIIGDHMPAQPNPARWWLFRPMSFYQSLFRLRGVELAKIGSVMQLEDEITILAGRRSPSQR